MTDYLEGRLAPADHARFEEHVAICPGCQAYMDQMRETLAALGRLPEEQLSPDARNALLVAFGGWKAGR